MSGLVRGGGVLASVSERQVVTLGKSDLVPVVIFVRDKTLSEARELKRLLLHRALEPKVDLPVC